MPEAEQGHVAAGTPEGGQWTDKQQTRPEAQLAENSTGSFLFPPLDYESVESYMRYWQNVPVSDRVLSNLVTAYATRRLHWIGEGLDIWAEKYGNDPEILAWANGPKVSAAMMDVAFGKARADEAERLAGLRPSHINGMQARGIAIAAQMYQWSASFSEEEQEQIENFPVRLSRLRDPMTVGDIWRTYGLKEIVRAAFTDNDISVQQELAGLRKRMGAEDSLNH